MAATIPNYGPHFLIGNFIFAYAAISTRFIKMSHGMDHNSNPRDDLAKYGEKRVQEGKMTSSQLAAIKRLQAAHENAVEHFPFFIAAIVMATQAGVENSVVNRYGLVYTAVRIAYALAYYKIEDHQASYIRSVLWWAGNITCIRLLWFAGKALNVAKV